ncbi:putative nitrate ABC transporter substrate binding protein [Phycisphaera mikurensis NBRC 102666]|uniref:Putative nitrate ABC transporter substrate binding protein n=2 Tax=Phycisphaera TaxID=666508 RepID=I0IG11_PHYMF|nr:putative nitrate ABC transporter substrate binding protein [Phycisphaera mikurensis NBRC 102666]
MKTHANTRPMKLRTATLAAAASLCFGFFSTPASAFGPAEVPAIEGGETEMLDIEKDELKFGFIKLTDCAPIVIAKEKGYFEDEGLFVEVTAQPNWKTLLDNVISGELDGAHMLSGQPIAATLGIGTKAHVITAFTMDLNGNAITVSNDVWSMMQENEPALDTPKPDHPITAEGLAPVVEDFKADGKKLQMGMVFPVSTHNYELRYWLAAAGIHPGMYTSADVGGRTDADVELSVTPPPLMPATLEAGNIQGYCVGEPWNQAAVAKGIGVPVVTNNEIWKNNPEKVFGVTKAWADENPQTMLAVTKALIKAARWLDETDENGDFVNRREAVTILSRPDYVGADADIIGRSMLGTFTFQKTDVKDAPDFNVFYKYFCNYPWYSDGVWFMTQMRRWGQIAEERPASWYAEKAEEVYKPEIFLEAAQMLVEEGFIAEDEIPVGTDGYKPATSDFIDGKTYDGKKPLEYLAGFEIGNKK